jgi:hypothetical protein
MKKNYSKMLEKIEDEDKSEVTELHPLLTTQPEKNGKNLKSPHGEMQSD